MDISGSAAVELCMAVLCSEDSHISIMVISSSFSGADREL